MGVASLWILRLVSFVGTWALGTILTMALEVPGEVVKFIWGVVTLPFHFFKFVLLGWRQVETSDANNAKHD
jgi:hypothetical protein